jgi:hypothetical protein
MLDPVLSDPWVRDPDPEWKKVQIRDEPQIIFPRAEPKGFEVKNT